MQSKRILIVGCGDLGSRHLQAICAMPQVTEVEVIEPSAEGLDLGRKRVDEVKDRNPKITYRWLRSFDEASRGGDLCIVATLADVRCQVTHDVVNQLEYSSFLLEKMVAQSIGDYERLIQFSEKMGLSIWVNCQMRAHDAFKRAKEKINSELPFVFSVTGGNHGLATNGIHAADLFVFYAGTDAIEEVAKNVDMVLHPSKRGGHFFDLSGTLYGVTDKGSNFMLALRAGHNGPMCYSLFSSEYRSIVEDTTRTHYESSQDSGWSWQQIPLSDDMNVSAMTRVFTADVLTRGRSEWPSLKACFPAHSFILKSLMPHFQKLMKSEQEKCPVT